MKTLRCSLRNFVARNRITLQDSTMILAAVAVFAYLLVQINIFDKPGKLPLKNTIEPDEIPILGLVLSVGMLIFSWRRLRQQKRESAARNEAQTQLRLLMFQDPVTGLPNRRRLVDQLNVALSSPPGADVIHSLMMLDLNGFKRINDVFGHAIGDQALVVVGHRLLKAVRAGDLVARVGGDEFAIVATHLSGVESATNLALKIIDAISPPIVVDKFEHSVNICIGICSFPFNNATPDSILRGAKVALHKSKRAGPWTFRFFNAKMDAQARERDFIEFEFRRALIDKKIEPFYQPLVDLNTRKIVGFEVLARWTHPSLGMISPERFIAIAEDTGLIDTLTDHLLRVACHTARNWPKSIFLSFNISGGELQDRNLGPRILEIMKDNGLCPRRLEIEITESSLVRDVESAAIVVDILRIAGVSIALDDFGTGYSSLYHLRLFRPDKIKIDRSFVHNIQDDKQSREIVSALVGLGKGLGITVTAEGIENPVEEAMLVLMGCNQGQGFLFSEAVSAQGIAALLI